MTHKKCSAAAALLVTSRRLRTRVKGLPRRTGRPPGGRQISYTTRNWTREALVGSCLISARSASRIQFLTDGTRGGFHVRNPPPPHCLHPLGCCAGSEQVSWSIFAPPVFQWCCCAVRAVRRAAGLTLGRGVRLVSRCFPCLLLSAMVRDSDG